MTEKDNKHHAEAPATQATITHLGRKQHGAWWAQKEDLGDHDGGIGVRDVLLGVVGGHHVLQPLEGVDLHRHHLILELDPCARSTREMRVTTMLVGVRVRKLRHSSEGSEREKSDGVGEGGRERERERGSNKRQARGNERRESGRHHATVEVGSGGSQIRQERHEVNQRKDPQLPLGRGLGEHLLALEHQTGTHGAQRKGSAWGQSPRSGVRQQASGMVRASRANTVHLRRAAVARSA